MKRRWSRTSTTSEHIQMFDNIKFNFSVAEWIAQKYWIRGEFETQADMQFTWEFAFHLLSFKALRFSMEVLNCQTKWLPVNSDWLHRVGVSIINMTWFMNESMPILLAMPITWTENMKRSKKLIEKRHFEVNKNGDYQNSVNVFRWMILRRTFSVVEVDGEQRTFRQLMIHRQNNVNWP